MASPVVPPNADLVELQLRRTGPLVPDVTFPSIGNVVVRDWLRADLLGSGLSGATFSPAPVVCAVPFNWQAWGTGTATQPADPPEGDWANLLLRGNHDRALAARMEPLWWLRPKSWGQSLSRPENGRYSRHRVALLCGEGEAPDFFHARGTKYMFVSERTKAWLSEVTPDSVEFIPTLPWST
jgi:hypothetical protein